MPGGDPGAGGRGLSEQGGHRRGGDTGRHVLGGSPGPAQPPASPASHHGATGAEVAVGAGLFGVAVPVSPKPMKWLHSHTGAQAPTIVQPLIFFALGRGVRRMWLWTTWYPSGTGIGWSPLPSAGRPSRPVPPSDVAVPSDTN
ncbi:hypothetical protein GCM10018790_51830 [Kitasatospora xanthocidica]|nr:hypothetical protein GCM10018790_51830 [Kitasatospora xanthocidica]